MNRNKSKAKAPTNLFPFTVLPSYDLSTDAVFPDSPELSRLLWKYVWSIGAPVYVSRPIKDSATGSEFLSLQIRSHVVYRGRKFHVPYATGFVMHRADDGAYITLLMYNEHERVEGRIGELSNIVTFKYSHLPRNIQNLIKKVLDKRALQISQ